MKATSKLWIELVAILLTLPPVVFLFWVWNELPDTVPLHFNWEGEVDKYANKETLLYVVVGVTIGVYLIIKFLPMLVSNQRIKSFFKTYQIIRIVMALFVSAVFCYLIYVSLNQAQEKGFVTRVVIGLAGLLMSVMGLLMPSIKQNYAMGFRLPTTLKSEKNWVKTHKLGGLLWFWHGLLLFVAVFFIQKEAVVVFFWVVFLVCVLLPILYSVLLKTDKEEMK